MNTLARFRGHGHGPARHALAVAVTAVCLLSVQAPHAQVSSATLRGQITASGTAAPAGTPVVAVNKATGIVTRGTTRDDGSYVLVGLPPGDYELRVGEGAAQTTRDVSLRVGENATVDVATGGEGGGSTQTIVVTASAYRQGAKESQVGTNVSPQYIEKLPQATHNFLSSADLAPGVAFQTDRSGNTKIQSGAQNFDHVNVFIDGVGQKNNILRGGLTGQDTSRGNPFPQSAIAEYKVLTQNYKAEFDQVSSAAISAVTKSGTNEFHGDVYVDRTGTNWRAKSPFEKAREDAGVKLPESSQYEYGFSLGGPIKQDQAHFFVAYDGKQIDDSRQVVPQRLDLLPADQGIVPSLIAQQGGTVDTFKEHLLFGKVDALVNEDNKLIASFKLRREDDKIPEDRLISAPGNDKERSNDETRFDVKHEWLGADWFSEARVGYENAVWNPHSASTDPMVRYKAGLDAADQRLGNSVDVLLVGGSPDAQRREQTGVFLSEDLSYSGIAGHVIKGGVKVKRMRYDLSGTALSVDSVETLIDRTTGLPYYSGGLCTGTNLSASGLTSDQCNIRSAIGSESANFSNTQIGLYIQDDWNITRKLELNYGIRWDYETNMLNNSYETPADRVAALYAPDVERYGITPPPGQTYAESLALGGVDIGKYISTGDRKAYTKAFAPRIGASYDIFGNQETVVYGGYGRSYDRTMANHALDELQKNKQTGGEIWLINNDYKMPYADQFSLGVRQGIGVWNTSATISRINAKNQFIWYGGNRDANGGYANQSPIDPLWGGPAGYGTLILGDFVGETKTNALLLSAEKPYTEGSGWSVNVAYTYSDAKTTSREWNNDIFDWTYGRPGARGWNRSTLVDKHRLVVAGFSDRLLPWGLSIAGKFTYGSGFPRRLTDCSNGFDQCVSREADSSPFRQFDLGLSKGFKAGPGEITLRADVLNLFNTINYGGRDDWVGGPAAAGAPANKYGGDNLNVGTPNDLRGDMRTVRLSLGYRF